MPYDASMGDDMMGADISSGYSVESIGATLPHNPVTSRRQTEGRRMPLGIDSVTAFALGLVPAGAQAVITNRPQVLFRLERFVVPSDIAALWTIDDILVGNASVFAATGSVPARMFDEQATNIMLGTATNQPATDLTVKTTNVSGALARFRAGFVGIAMV